MSAHTVYAGVLPSLTDRPPRPEADRRATHILAAARWRDLPGQPTDNRLEQAQHLRNLPYVAVRAVYTALAGGTLDIFRKRTRREVKGVGVNHGQPGQDEKLVPVPDSHPLRKLLRRPSKYDTFSRLVADWVIQRSLTGTAFLWPVEAVTGKPCALYVVPTAGLQALPQSPYYPEGAYRVVNSLMAPMLAGVGYGAGAVLPRDMLIVDRLPHPLYQWDGYSPLTAGGVQIDLLEQIDQARHAAMRHGVTPDAILNLPGASPEVMDRTEQQFRNAYGGSQNHRKVIVSDGDSIDAKLLNTAPKDMDFASGWEQMTKFVLALFGVPPSVAGLTEPGSYAAYYAALQQFNTNTLAGLCREFGELLTVHLAERFWPDEGLEVRLSLPHLANEEQEEAKFQADRAVGLRTFNDERTYRSLPPVPDGDVPAPLYLQRATAQMQQAMQPPQPPGGGGGVAAPAPDDDDSGTSAGPNRPDTPSTAGGLPPMPKAMSAYDASAGGSLVAPAAVPARPRRLTRRRSKRLVARALKAAGLSDDSEGERVADILDGYRGTSPVGEFGRRTGNNAPPVPFTPKEAGGEANPYVGDSPDPDEPGWTITPASGHVYRFRWSPMKRGSVVFTRPTIYVQFWRHAKGSTPDNPTRVPGDTYAYYPGSNELGEELAGKLAGTLHPYGDVVYPLMRKAGMAYTRVGNG